MNDLDYTSPVERTCDSGTLATPVWKQVLLWIAVLPGAILGSTAVYWIARLLMWLSSSFYGDDSWLNVIFERFITNAACGYSLAFCGAFIAPRRKITVAIVLASLVLFLSGITIIVYIRDHRWLDLLGSVSLLVGAIAYAVEVATGEQKFK